MAKSVTIKKLGGDSQVLYEAFTVGQALQQAGLADQGYTASVNGQPAELSAELSDYDFIALSKPVKGGR